MALQPTSSGSDIVAPRVTFGETKDKNPARPHEPKPSNEAKIVDEPPKPLPKKYSSVEKPVPEAVAKLLAECVGELAEDDPFAFQKRMLGVQFTSMMTSFKYLEISRGDVLANEMTSLLLQGQFLEAERHIFDGLRSGAIEWNDDSAREVEQMYALYNKSMIALSEAQTHLYEERLAPLAESMLKIEELALQLHTDALPAYTGEMAPLMRSYLSTAKGLHILKKDGAKDAEELMALQKKVADQLSTLIEREASLGKSASSMGWLGGERALESAQMMTTLEGLELREKGLMLGAELFAAQRIGMEPRMIKILEMQGQQAIIQAQMLLPYVSGTIPTAVESAQLMTEMQALQADIAKLHDEVSDIQSETIVPKTNEALEVQRQEIAWTRAHIDAIDPDFRDIFESTLQLNEEMFAVQTRMVERNATMRETEGALQEISDKIAGLQQQPSN